MASTPRADVFGVRRRLDTAGGPVDFYSLAALQSQGDFEESFLNGWTEGRSGVDISCTVRYEPKAGAGRRR